MTRVTPEPAAPTVNVNLPRRGSSLGVASIVLGALAFLICWIPLLGALGIPLSGLGLLLGMLGLIIALFHRGSGVGFCVAGMAICGLSLFLAVTVTKAVVTSIQEVSNSTRQQAIEDQSTHQEVVPGKAPATHPSAPSPEPVVPAPSTPSPTTPTAEPEVTWAPATSPVRQGDVQVRVVSVRVDKVALQSPFSEGGSLTKESLLAITLELTNVSQNRKLDYHTWAGADFTVERDYATLQDNFGNTYRRIGFGLTTQPIGRTEQASLYPGKAQTDVLVFEEPVAGVEYLNLELPAANFGGTGMIRLRVPASMIQR
ncbi:MAG: hypothetical protein IT442_05220 [Phycisphaeraceae bacterium]|nr:hypothetical protein [Phycisphaeraceae bacterium]